MEDSRKTYLSIDLDYWNSHPDSLDCRNFFHALSKALKDKGISPKIVKSHESLFPHVNRSGCSVLLNLDYHSDLADLDASGRDEKNRRVFNDGTWANFVKWQAKGKFTWLMPSRKDCYRDRRGRCDLTRNPFETRCTGWKETKASTGWKRIDFGAIAAVGISVSPDYLDDPEAIRPAIEMFPEIEGMLNARIEHCKVLHSRDFQAGQEDHVRHVRGEASVMRKRCRRKCYRYKDGFRMPEARLVSVRPGTLRILNPQHVRRSVADFYAKTGSQPPPGLMIRKSYGVIILDGFHRLAAAKQRKRLFRAWQVDWEQARLLWPGGEAYDDDDDLGSMDEYVLCDGKPYVRDLRGKFAALQDAAWLGVGVTQP